MGKTGTLTKGAPEVTRVITTGAMDESRPLPLVAAVEKHSEHPLGGRGRCVCRRARSPGRGYVGLSNVPGHGAVADVGGRGVVVGNRKLMADDGVELGSLRLRSRRPSLAQCRLTRNRSIGPGAEGGNIGSSSKIEPT